MATPQPQTSLEGTATDTLASYNRQKEIGIQAAQLSQELLKRFSPEKVAERPNPEDFFQPLLREQAAQPPPTPAPLPPAPQFNVGTLLGLLGSNLGANLTGREGIGTRAITSRIQERRDIAAANREEQNRFEAAKWKTYYETRSDVLKLAFEQAVSERNADKALAIQDAHFIVQSGLDAVNQALKRQQDFDLARLNNAANANEARIRNEKEDTARNDEVLKQRRAALADMNRVASQLAVKIKADKGFLPFGKPKMTDEEFSAQMRGLTGYLQFGDSPVEVAAQRHIIGLMNERYGKNLTPEKRAELRAQFGF